MFHIFCFTTINSLESTNDSCGTQDAMVYGMNNETMTEAEYLEAIKQWDAMIADIFAPLYEDDDDADNEANNLKLLK